MCPLDTSHLPSSPFPSPLLPSSSVSSIKQWHPPVRLSVCLTYAVRFLSHSFCSSLTFFLIHPSPHSPSSSLTQVITQPFHYSPSFLTHHLSWAVSSSLTHSLTLSPTHSLLHPHPSPLTLFFTYFLHYPLTVNSSITLSFTQAFNPSSLILLLSHQFPHSLHSLLTLNHLDFTNPLPKPSSISITKLFTEHVMIYLWDTN